MKADFETAKAGVAAKNAELNQCSKEIKELQREKDGYLKTAQAKGLDARKLAHKLKEWEKEAKERLKKKNRFLVKKVVILISVVRMLLSVQNVIKNLKQNRYVRVLNT